MYIFFNQRGTFFCQAKRKVPKKVWKRVMGFGEEGKNLSSKRFFPLPQVPLPALFAAGGVYCEGADRQFFVYLKAEAVEQFFGFAQ